MLTVHALLYLQVCFLAAPCQGASQALRGCKGDPATWTSRGAWRLQASDCRVPFRAWILNGQPQGSQLHGMLYHLEARQNTCVCVCGCAVRDVRWRGQLECIGLTLVCFASYPRCGSSVCGLLQSQSDDAIVSWCHRCLTPLPRPPAQRRPVCREELHAVLGPCACPL